MDDAGAVQRRSAARELDRDVAALLQTYRRPARQPRRQQLALVERHHGVEAGLPAGRQFDDAADPRTVDPRADPGFADKGRMIGGDRRDLRLGKFQHHLAAFDLVDRTEQAAIAAVGHQHLQQKAVDRLAHDRCRDQRQLHDGGADDLGRFRRRQLDHVDHHGGAVVGRAGIERGGDQRTRGIFRRRALAQNVGDGLGPQIAVHAVAAQQEAVVQRHRLGGVVEPHFGLDAERAEQDVGAAGAGGALAHMVGGEQRQAITAEPIGAAVTNMQHMRNPPAQHDRGEGASHAGERRVALALGIDPAIERADDGRRGAAHLHGLGQVAKAVEKAAHRGFGGDTAALGAANAVGDSGDDVAARLWQFPAEHGAAEIFVALARSGLGGEPHACLDARNPLSHRPNPGPDPGPCGAG